MNIQNLHGEEWKPFPIQGYPRYRVSNMGRIYSDVSGGIMSPQENRDGYFKIRAGWKDSAKNYFVHRLVALAFNDNPDSYPVVNHLDGDKKNNKSSNLEWCSQSENVKHSFRIGLQCNKGENHPQSKLKDKDILKIRSMFKDGYSRRQLADKFNTKPSNIKDIVLRRSWKHV